MPRQIVVIKPVRLRFHRTEIEIKGSWQQGHDRFVAYAYKLGRSFRHFGHNSPAEKVVPKTDSIVMEDIDFVPDHDWCRRPSDSPSV